MAYYNGELLKQNFGKALNEFEGLNVPLSEVAIKVGQAIKNTPTADVVEVVRCKDCKHFCEYSEAHKRAVERADGDCFIRMMYSLDHQFYAVRYNDFCSYGERK